MAYPRGFGYVLDFSDRSMEEYFADEFGINIHDNEYSANGTSKRNCLTTFLSLTDAYTALRVLRALYDRREGLLESSSNSSSAQVARSKSRGFLEVIEQLAGDPSAVSTDGIDSFARDRTLEELVSDIERTLAANKPEVAIDHLHTYCVKKFTHLLVVRGIECTDDEPLHSRFGKYRKCLEQEQNLHEFTLRALKSFISLFDSFNDLRNNRSLAHDNELLEPVEARLVVNTVNAILVFLRALESARYGD